MITIKLDNVVAGELLDEIDALKPKHLVLRTLRKALRQARKQKKNRLTIKVAMTTRSGISSKVDISR